jgi:hypothetical protein
MNEPTFKVASMPRASYAEDGSEIQMEFQADDNRRITLAFEPNALDLFVSRTMQIVNHARNQKLSIGDHFAIQASEVVAALAQAPAGGGKVILALRGTNGILQHFALTPNEADSLRPQLHQAAKSARTQAAKARH